MQEQCGKERSTRKQKCLRQAPFSTYSSFLTNKQGGRNHSGVDQSKIIIKPPTLIHLKVTQSKKKNMCHSSSEKRNIKKEGQPNVTNITV